jgi:NADH-quinone oxidoreductase subunit G
LPVYIVLDLLANDATALASVVLPSLGFAEKRGSMINGKGRLQRLNRAVRGPGEARDDWEILRDLVQAISGENAERNARVGGLHTIEDVFRRMSEAVPEFAGLTLSRISDLGVPVRNVDATPGDPAREKMREPEREKQPQ